MSEEAAIPVWDFDSLRAHLARIQAHPSDMIACTFCGEAMIQRVGRHEGTFILYHCSIYIAEETRELAIKRLSSQ